MTQKMERVPGKPHKVLLLSGLGDNKDVWGFNKILEHDNWKNSGFETQAINMDWMNPDETFEQKLERLTAVIDELYEDFVVSIIGASAGGSMAFNLLIARLERVSKAISVCSRLRKGHHFWRSFDRMTDKSPSFAKSVVTFEKQEPDIPQNVRDRMMTWSAKFDELVPLETSQLEGATNVDIPSIEHMFTMYISLTKFSQIIIDFIADVDAT
jgi:pimeloyl-ACP methyl ester carboxylesterase